MFRCTDLAERASLLIDGELGPWQSFNMKLHLAMCRGCGAFVKQMRITRDLTRMVVAIEPENQHDLPINEDIMAALRARRLRSRSTP